MDQHLLEKLRASSRGFRASPGRKFLRHPWRMFSSIALARLGKLRRKSFHASAATFWGGRINIMLPELGSLTLYRYGLLEENLSYFFLSVLRPGMTAFDIGAHFGYFTLLAARLVGPQGRVHSFEPTPSTYAVLQSNVAGAGNIHTNNAAVFSRSAEMEFQDFGVEFSEFNSLAGGKIHDNQRQQAQPTLCRVRALALDEYVEKTGAAPDLLKIDAERAEFDILQGMPKLLDSAKPPVISLEVGDNSETDTGSFRPVQYLLDRGFRAFDYDVSTGQPRRHVKQVAYTYNNLLLVPPQRFSEVPFASV